MIDIYVPSYHRPNNFTLRYLQKIGYDMKKVTIFVDDGADDMDAYKVSCRMAGCNLAVFSLEEARKRYDYVHRANVLRRTAGQARNMFFDYAKEKGVDFFCVMDDDTTGFERKGVGRKAARGQATSDDIFRQMGETEQMMKRRKIGCFGWSQSGDFIGGENTYILRPKVMNMTFYLLPYVDRGERGVLDTDTSAFVGMMNEGFFVGSYGGGVYYIKGRVRMIKEGLRTSTEIVSYYESRWCVSSSSQAQSKPKSKRRTGDVCTTKSIFGF